ncbi:MAG TPA: aspartate aminotransferase family protein, partial [Acidisoma sp.]|nr:aspartate aminotransferase family protein [Acidisoma sp.]
MLGVELVQDKETKTPFAPALGVGLTFDRLAYKNGLIVRCMGDTLGMAPPLIVQESDVDEIAEKFSKTLTELEAQFA